MLSSYLAIIFEANLSAGVLSAVAGGWVEGCRQQTHSMAAPAVLQPPPNESSAPLGHDGGIQHTKSSTSSIVLY